MNLLNFVKKIGVKIFQLGQNLASPKFWRKTFVSIWHFFTFFILLNVFWFRLIGNVLRKTPLKLIINRFNFVSQLKIVQKLSRFIEGIDKIGTISKLKRSYLINLAYRNMRLKKTRSFIAIFGMAVGIAAIVFLVSLGYGLERLVINRVARLEELKMADVSLGESTALRLNSETLVKIEQIGKVKDVIPLISIVGKINFNNATTDVLVYAAPKKYLELSQLQLMKGNFYDNNEVSWCLREGEVAGAQVVVASAIINSLVNGSVINFNINPERNTPVWSEPVLSARVLGYTSRIEGGYYGQEYWGGNYYSDSGEGNAGFDSEKGSPLGIWLKVKVPLYQKNAEGKLIPSLDELGRQIWQWGWLMKRDVVFELELKNTQFLGKEKWERGEVLGTQSASLDEASATAEIAIMETVVVATDSSGVEWVEMQSATASAKTEKQVLNFKAEPSNQAIISSSMLKLFNLSADQVIGNSFKTSFILVKSLMPEIESKVLSEEKEYKIIGVINDDSTPYFYIPFQDMVKLGVSNFSQLKVLVDNQYSLPEVRNQIETLGFRTSSTVDTVKQIEKLFTNLRLLLGLLGMIALSVAVLGMFNTLTVSLLERTREIGGMKAMGMLSSEVKDLLLAEAMIMGFSGGLVGLGLGICIGKLASVAISSVAIIKGEGFLNLTYLPYIFTFFIVVSSFFVGIITGIYPAKRATKISALDALRYE